MPFGAEGRRALNRRPTEGSLGGGDMSYVLLVTWFAHLQPPTSYQTVFDSARACGLARFAVLADAERMKSEVGTAPELAASNGSHLSGPAVAPRVSVICTPKR